MISTTYVDRVLSESKRSARVGQSKSRKIILRLRLNLLADLASAFPVPNRRIRWTAADFCRCFAYKSVLLGQ